MKITSRVNHAHLKAMQIVFMRSQVKTCDALKSDLQDSQTIPFDMGSLQNTKTFVNDKNIKKGIVSIVSEGPYARYHYFGVTSEGEKLNHSQVKNSNAGPFWFEPYLNGNKKEMPQKSFNKFVKKEMQSVIK